MTDILLIQPPIRDFYLTAKRTIPYGLASIAAVLLKNGYTVEILDALAGSKSRTLSVPEEMSYLHDYYGRPDRSPFALFHQYKHFGLSFAHIGKIAKASKAFLVGISSLFTPYMQDAVETAEIVKSYHPTCKIVIGGHHAASMPETVMGSEAVDFVIRGEGEVSMPLLAEAVAGKRSVDAVPGIVYRKSNQELSIKEPAAMNDMDCFPIPAIHLIDHQFYQRAGKKSGVIVTSRGCPMTCSYCCVGATSYHKYRRKSVETVLREIEDAVQFHDVGFIDFEDENLTLDRSWILKLLQKIKMYFHRSRLELRAMNGLFPPSLDSEVIEKMKEAGFKTLNLSLGTTSQQQLKRFQRPDVRKAFDRALRLSESFDMNAVGYIIIGAPYQKAKSSVSDLLFLAQRRVLVGVSVFYPAPGSKDFDCCQKLSILPKHLSCMRSSALPLSHTTTRLESVTLLRLGRLLNFIKSLNDTSVSVADLLDEKIKFDVSDNRIQNGIRLLQSFLVDGRIRGISPQGEIFEHHISKPLADQFLEGLKSIRIKGCG